MNKLFFASIALFSMTACMPVPLPVPPDNDRPPVNDPFAELAPEETATMRTNLIGTWYIYDLRPDGTEAYSTAVYLEDGTLNNEFIVLYPDGSSWRSNESGFWGVSGGVYFTLIRSRTGDDGRYTNSPEDPANYLAYKIHELTPTVFRYQTFVTGNNFEAGKVPDDFTIPVNSP